MEQCWVAHDVKYCPGKSNANADALSRFPIASAAVELTPAGGPEEWAGSEWQDAQALDADIKMVVRCVEQQKVPPVEERRTWSRGAKALFRQQKRLQVRDHIL